MTDCIFCKIISGELPSYSLYEDEYTFSFLDIHPVNKGHVLVISKKHYADFLDVDTETLIALTKSAHTISQAVKKGVSADGCNVTTNAGAAAGQVIFHMHWHIIPRFKDDGLKLWPSQGDYTQDDAQAIQEAIVQNL